MSDDFIFEKSAEKHQKGFTLSLIATGHVALETLQDRNPGNI